jgi:hypothetical protein
MRTVPGVTAPQWAPSYTGDTISTDVDGLPRESVLELTVPLLLIIGSGWCRPAMTMATLVTAGPFLSERTP